MISVNSVVISGFLAQNPRSGQTQKGHRWSNASLGISKRRHDGSYETHWIRLVGWQDAAIELSCFHKGDLLVVEGELQTSSYEKDGVKHYSTEVVVHAVGLMVAPVDGGEEAGEKFL